MGTYINPFLNTSIAKWRPYYVEMQCAILDDVTWSRDKDRTNNYNLFNQYPITTIC